MGKFGVIRTEETRKKISDSLKGRPKSDWHKRKISSGLKRKWAERASVDRKSDVRAEGSKIIARDVLAWKESGCIVPFRQFLEGLPLNNARADFLYGNCFVLFRQIDPVDGSCLNINFAKSEAEALSSSDSSLKQGKRIRHLWKMDMPAKLEIVATGLSFREANRQKKELMWHHRESQEIDGS